MADKEERVMIFIDGSNMYHSLKAYFHRTDIDLGKFCDKLVNKRQLVRIYYYNVEVGQREEPERYKDQRSFFDSVEAIPYTELRLGRLVYTSAWPNTPPYEKGVDVMLATDMLTHCYQKQLRYRHPGGRRRRFRRRAPGRQGQRQTRRSRPLRRGTHLGAPCARSPMWSTSSTATCCAAAGRRRRPPPQVRPQRQFKQHRPPQQPGQQQPQQAQPQPPVPQQPQPAPQPQQPPMQQQQIPQPQAPAPQPAPTPMPPVHVDLSRFIPRPGEAATRELPEAHRPLQFPPKPFNPNGLE